VGTHTEGDRRDETEAGSSSPAEEEEEEEEEGEKELEEEEEGEVEEEEEEGEADGVGVREAGSHLRMKLCSSVKNLSKSPPQPRAIRRSTFLTVTGASAERATPACAEEEARRARRALRGGRGMLNIAERVFRGDARGGAGASSVLGRFRVVDGREASDKREYKGLSS
jgi:hypothetical protein